MTWREAVDAAVVGAAKAPVPALPATVGVPTTDGDPGERLLTSAAAWSRVRRAGHRPAAIPGDTPAPAPLDDERPPPPAAAGQRLRELLLTNRADLVVEWLTAAHDRFRPPDDQLVRLLDLAQRNHLVNAAVVSGIGPRARWLVSLHTAWPTVQFRAPLDDIDIDLADQAAVLERWSTGALATRESLLLRVRAVDRGLALRLMHSTWTQDKAKARDDLLTYYVNDVHPEEEPFLEKALDDRSAEVRATAVAGLSRLPDSRYARDAATRAASVLAVHKSLLRRVVTITPPAELTPAMARDGVLPVPKGHGAQAWLLQQVVAAADPSVWQSVHGLPADELLKAIAKDDWAKPFTVGLSNAARRMRHAETLLALVATDDGASPTGFALVEALPPDVRQQLVAQRLDDGDANDAARLRNLPTPWSPELVAAVTRAITRRLPSAPGLDRLQRTNPFLSVLFEHAALRLPLDARIAVRLEDVHPDHHKAYLTFLDVLQTRAAIRRELTEEIAP